MWWYWCFLFFLLFEIPLLKLKNRGRSAAVFHKRRKGYRGGLKMKELIEELIGKNCTVNTVDGKSYEGIIDCLKENWLVIKSDYWYEKQVVNIEYIIGVCEKKEKKKKER